MEGGLLSLKWNNHKSTFFHVLSNVRKKKDSYSDATLACDGKFYPVHKLVLSSCSDYFEEMFDQAGQAQCKHPFIVLKDIKCDELECLLSYMYVGEVNVVQEKLAGLIKAAECLRIKGLAVPDEEPSNSSNKSSREKRQSDNSVNSEPKRRRQDEASSSSRQNNSRSGERRKSTESENIIKSNTVSDSSSHQTDRKEKPSTNDIVKTEEEDDEPTEMPIMVKEEIDTVDLIEETSHDNFSDMKDTDTDDMGFDDGTFMANDSNSREDTMNQSAGTSQMGKSGESRLNGGSGGWGVLDEDYSTLLNLQLASAIEKLPPLSFSTDIKSEGVRGGPRVSRQLKHNIPLFDNLDLGLILTAERFFKCPECERVCSDKAQFRRHYFTHTGERPHACPFCPYRGIRKCDITYHMRSQHMAKEMASKDLL